MDFHKLRTDLLALGLLALCVFVGLSLIGYDPADPPARIVHPPREVPANPCGTIGAIVAHGLRSAFGLGAWFVLLCLVSLDVRLFAHRQPESRLFRVAGWVLSASAVCVGLRLLAGNLDAGPAVGSGGYLGAIGLALLEPHVSLMGTLILVGTLFVAGLMLSGDLSFFQRMVWLTLLPARLVARPLVGSSADVSPAPALAKRSTPKPSKKKAETTADDVKPWQSAVADWEEAVDEEAEPIAEDGVALAARSASDEAAEADELDADDENPQEEDGEPLVRRPLKINPPAGTVPGKTSDRDEIIARLEAGSQNVADEEFELPAFDLLEEAE
ncbi:MAG: DNA translocase FtsK 4TM domain-containing protein, partial [Planctomycetaceae bacterium]